MASRINSETTGMSATSRGEREVVERVYQLREHDLSPDMRRSVGVWRRGAFVFQPKASTGSELGSTFRQTRGPARSAIRAYSSGLR